MNREEHLQWCKDRAMAYVKEGDLRNAINSMLSDLNKHPETANHPGCMLGLVALISPTKEKVTRFILGFN